MDSSSSRIGGAETGRIAVEHAAEVHGAQHVLALGVGGIGAAELQVVAKGPREHRGILLDVADLRTQFGAVE